MAVMARGTTTTPPPEDFEENIVDIDVTEEMRGSYLEYAYSVIYQRALPDARDGLKPVQRRILYQMREMGLTPQRAHIKCAQVVGQVMGLLHPHGDGAIYDALVRMQQPWAMRLPLIDGHGNFGSLDDPPAAMRYTEARLAAAAVEMTASLDEDTRGGGEKHDPAGVSTLGDEDVAHLQLCGLGVHNQADAATDDARAAADAAPAVAGCVGRGWALSGERIAVVDHAAGGEPLGGRLVGPVARELGRAQGDQAV